MREHGKEGGLIFMDEGHGTVRLIAFLRDEAGDVIDAYWLSLERDMAKRTLRELKRKVGWRRWFQRWPDTDTDLDIRMRRLIRQNVLRWQHEHQPLDGAQ